MSSQWFDSRVSVSVGDWSLAERRVSVQKSRDRRFVSGGYGIEFRRS